VGSSNSPFTTALVKHLPTPGLDVELALRRVRDEVLRATKNRQEPFKYGSLGGAELPLVSASTGSTAATTKPVDAGGAKLSEAAEAWSVVKDAANTAVLEAYIARFKDTFYADLARARIDELKKQQAAAAGTAKPEAGSEAQSIVVGNYAVEKRSNLTGQVLGKRTLASVDASKPDAAIQTCASACDAAPQCLGFDFSIVYGNCSLYSKIEKKDPLAGYISGTRLKQVAPATPAKSAETSDPMRPGSVFRDCPDCPEMVVVPAGSFMMGSTDSERSTFAYLRISDEGPVHKVSIAKPFAVGTYEVTFAEWDACVSAGGCKYRPGDEGWGRGRRPVINVSWDDISKEYLPWLSRRAGEGYRLLTEAEWEYAARAGTTTLYATGATISTDQANYNGNWSYGK
jgi:Sulfatase-modifying factor enzyme 1